MSFVYESALDSLRDKKWEDYDEITCMDGTKIDMQQLLDDQARAKASLAVHAPAWGGLLSKLRFVYTFRVETQATDGEFIFVNPQFTAGLDNTGKVFVMAHELLHCLLEHMRRGRNHDRKKSNIAADYEVNSTIVDLGLISAGTITGIGALYDKKYKDLGYETIYDMGPSGQQNGNMSNNQSGQQGAGQNQQSGSGNQNQNQQGQSQSGGSGNQSQNQQGQQGAGQGQKKQNQSGAGQSQSGSDGNDGSNNEYQTADGGRGRQVTADDCESPASLSQVPGNPGGMLDKAEGNKIATQEGHQPGEGGMDDNKWKDAALQAAQKMKGEGALGAFRNKLNGIHKTTTDWKSILKKIVGRSISPMDKRMAYTHKNRLAAFGKIYKTEKDDFTAVDYIAAFIDTSGSMADEDLKLCLREMYTMALAKKPCNILILQFDSAVADVQVYSSLKAFENDIKLNKIKMKGGGGTNVRPCFDFLKTDKRFKGRTADVCVIFTDGYIDVVKRDPRTMRNLVWCIIDNTGFDLPDNKKDSNTKVVYASSKK